ncbi:hypothetical protein TSUD_280470 [Trifolium subterraneum]|uniref:Uncharacterized protein n=1 Tax=Trifolium subterraneum TaxID=3900 RepID=A0A2Z6NQH5_TRISU|nr:hypothetical protein TSUD_280470 [Trifolium subterraneum]
MKFKILDLWQTMLKPDYGTKGDAVYVFIQVHETLKTETSVLKGQKSDQRMGPVLLRCTVQLQLSQGPTESRKNGSN